LEGGKAVPKILEKAVSRIKAGGVPTKSAWPMAVASQQKAGNIKPGTLQATKQGVARGQMTQAQRQANPPGKKK
jgi:hypothetical protein